MSRNEGIRIIAEFNERAVSLTGLPGNPNSAYGRAKNAGITIIADFTDKAQPVEATGPKDPTPERE